MEETPRFARGDRKKGAGRQKRGALGDIKRGLGATSLLCLFKRSEKSLSCGRERQKGRPLTSFGVTAHPCLPEAHKRRGTPRFARGDKEGGFGVTEKEVRG